MDESIIGKKTMGQLADDIRNLNRSRRQALAVILDDMKLGTMVNRYNEEN